MADALRRLRNPGGLIPQRPPQLFGNGATSANPPASAMTLPAPFTENLLKHLETVDLDVRQMFFRVQNDVGSKCKQLPEVSNSLIRAEFKLKYRRRADTANPRWAP